MNWFDDYERMQREIERLARGMSPTIELMRQLERSYDFFGITSDFLRAADIAREAAGPLRRLTEGPYFRQFSDEIARQHVDITRLLTDARQFYGGPLAEVAGSVQAMAALAGPFPVARWYEDLVADAERLEREEGLEPVEARARLEKPLLETIAELPVTPATAQSIFSILLTLFLFWLGLRLSNASEARIMARIGEIESSFSETLELIGPNAAGDYGSSAYLVKRAATALSRPNGKQATGLVYSGQLVTILQRRGKWVQIEWIDMTGSVRTGWILKKYAGRVR